MLPLNKQNAYRERYKRLRSGWRTSGEEFEALTRSHITPQSRVLDLGCGRGGVMELFWQEVNLAVGLDPDYASLVEHRVRRETSTLSVPDPGAKRTSRGFAKFADRGRAASTAAQSKGAEMVTSMPLVCGLGQALPFPNESFDLVIGLWLLEHLPRPEVVLTEIQRVLVPGGHFIFLTPNARHPLILFNRFSWAFPAVQRLLIPQLYGRSESDTFRVRYRANSLAQLRTLAAANGFRVVSLRALPDPTYLAFNDLFFQLSVLFERVLSEEWRIHIVGDFSRA